MLKGELLHPEMFCVLGRAGHGPKVLIAEGNYPFATGSPPSAHASRSTTNVANCCRTALN